MRIRRFAATTALAGLATAGLIGLTSATPASATSLQCIQYLQSVDEQSTLRDVTCSATETAADTQGDQYAEITCNTVMTIITGLNSEHAAEACQRAVQD
jgi:hypothetical protein